jgi:dihydroflavonol-4-reductase
MENSTHKKILVTGGTGLLGAHLLHQLVARGYSVRAICRSTSSKKVFEKVFAAYATNPTADMARVEWVTGDVTDYFSLEEAFVGIDTVYHVAGFISFQSKDKPKLENVNIQGTANVVDAAMQCGVKKVVYVSSVAALGRADLEGLISEETPWKNSPVNTHYAVTKQAGEREVWRGSEEGLEVLVVNPGLIIGYGDWTTGTGKIVKRIAEGQSFYTDGCNGWIDVRDAARAMIDLDEAGIHGEKFILIGQNVDFKSAFADMANHLGSKAPTIKAGPMLMRLAVWSEKFVSLFSGNEPLVTPETIMTASLQSRYDNSKIKNRIGFQFTPFEDTLQEVSKWYKLDAKS